MRREQVAVLQITTSALLTALLAVAVNVATGGDLPRPLTGIAWLAWPVVGLLAAALAALSVWQHRLSTADVPAVGDRPAQLPAARRVHGREPERKAVARAHDAVLITGPPGTGKTALALRVAHDLRRRYPDGQLYAALTELTTPESVLVAFLRALGVADESGGGLDELAGRYRTAVAGRRLLIMLDDAAEDDQIRPLLPGVDGCLVIVTSRRALSVPHTVRLDGLDLGAARDLLAEAAGERAGKLTADPGGTARILAACAGLPLAVQLAGARLRARPGWTATDLADRLDERRLDELHQGDSAVRSTFRTAYDGLTSTERLVFRRAGAQPGPSFGSGGAAAVTGLSPAEVTAVLDRLADSMLVEMPGPDRYRMHDLLRLYARELVDEHGEWDGCTTRLRSWLTSTAAPGPWRDAELDTALAVAAQGGPVFALADAVHRVLDRSGDHVYRLPLWQAALDGLPPGDGPERLRALRWIAHSHQLIGHVDTSLAVAAEAIAMAGRLGDDWEVAHCARVTGDSLRLLNRLDEAEESLLRSLTIFQEYGATDEEIKVRTTLGTFYHVAGRHQEAIDMVEKALLLREPGDDADFAWLQLGLAGPYRRLGRDDDALHQLDLAAGIARRIGDDFVLGYCHQEMGWIAVTQQRYADAERDFRRMLELLDGIQHGTGAGGAHRLLGVLALRRGRPRQAAAEFDAAIARFDRLGDTARADECRRLRAEVP